jgi:hypothetical protein
MMPIRRLFSIITVLALAACGGGGGSSGTSGFNTGGTTGGTPGGPTTSTPSAADLVFVLSATTVANSGTETVVATATAIDASRNTVAGVPVTISVDSDGVVTPSGPVTGTAGTLTGTVGIGSNRTNRTLTVTATSGSLTRTAVLQVQDTGGGTTGPSDLLLILGASTIASTGNQTVTANVTALDAKRNVLPGATVTLSVNNGTIAPAGTATGSNGVLTAAVGTAGSPSGTVIVVTAVAGGITRTANLRVVDVPSTTNPTAADLSLALSSTQLSNGGTGTITATITAVDSNRNALAGIPVTVSVDSNAVATVSSPVTNAQGVVTASLGYGSDRSYRSVLVTATSGTVTKTASFTVNGAQLTASYAPLVTAGSGTQQINYTVVDDNTNPMGNQPISITSATAGNASGTTDAFGKFAYTYSAPSSATTLTIAAASAGRTLSSQVAVQASGSSLPNASSVPQSASLTPAPTVVSINSAGSTANQVELRALFLGSNNAPISNVRVKFSLDPANASDGTVAQVSTPYVYSDATGVARATFTPGQRSSPTNGVTVRGCWDTADFDVNAACPANRQITGSLTIASEALSVNIRTNNLIQIGPSNLTYIKQFVVMVVDAAGQAKSGVLITPSIDLTAYYKGVFVFATTIWKQQLQLASTENYRWDTTAQAWQLQAAANPPQPSCPNEDVNRNGVREASAYPGAGSATPLSARGEDLNWNGDIDPRKSDVSIRMVGSATTDASGLAIVQIEYGQNLASWVDYLITVTASGVAGTESRATYVGAKYGNGNLPYPASAVTDETIPPAFVVSPYGRGSISGSTPTGVCTDTN